MANPPSELGLAPTEKGELGPKMGKKKMPPDSQKHSDYDQKRKQGGKKTLRG